MISNWISQKGVRESQAVGDPPDQANLITSFSSTKIWIYMRAGDYFSLAKCSKSGCLLQQRLAKAFKKLILTFTTV